MRVKMRQLTTRQSVLSIQRLQERTSMSISSHSMLQELRSRVDFRLFSSAEHQ